MDKFYIYDENVFYSNNYILFDLTLFGVYEVRTHMGKNGGVISTLRRRN